MQPYTPGNIPRLPISLVMFSFFIFVGGVAFVGGFLSGYPAQELALPVLMLGGFATMIAGPMALFEFIGYSRKQSGIRKAQEEPWAVWPQFASEAEWRHFTEA